VVTVGEACMPPYVRYDADTITIGTPMTVDDPDGEIECTCVGPPGHG
jgi:hypothetical protein